jgi:hypothetical protein
MAIYDIPAGTQYTIYSTSTGNFSSTSAAAFDLQITDNDPGDDQFDTSETLSLVRVSDGQTLGSATYRGMTTIEGVDYPVFAFPGGSTYIIGTHVTSATYPNVASLNLDTADFTVCFAAGTRIATPCGEIPVEDLTIGTRILTAEGRTVPVKWVGRQTVSTRFSPDRLRMIRIRAGALGKDLPQRDLVVTADHALALDGLLINAGALVNGSTIDILPATDLAERYTIYHVETEAHDVILAEGVPSETYVDYVQRRAFDNHAEYVELYGEDVTIPEMARPRITSARMLPAALRARLGLDTAA